MTTFSTYATATFSSGNIVVVQSAENMIPGLPITFLGNTFGNVTANATYYIGNISFGYPTSNITITSLPGGAVYPVGDGSGSMVASFSQGGQQIIPTVPPGEPLNQAFDAINVNFDQIWAAGPVGSNIQIDENTIYTLNTNGNLVLNPNGIGNVIANAHVIPDRDRTRNLGAPLLRWNTVYAQQFVGNISGNIVAGGSNGQIQYNNNGILAGANGFTFLANTSSISLVGNVTAGNALTQGFVSAAGGMYGDIYTTMIDSGDSSAILIVSEVNVLADLDVAGQISATGNIIGQNLLFGSGVVSGTGNIYADKIFANIQGNIDAAGNLYELQFNTTGDQLGASANLTYNFSNNVLTVSNGNIVGGNVLAGTVSATGNILANYYFGNGSQLTGITADNVNADDLVGNTLSGNVLYSSIISLGNLISLSVVGNTTTGNLSTSGMISAAGNITADYYFGNGSQLTGIDATSIQNGNSNVRVAANANVTVGVSGVSNVAVFTPTGLDVAGNISATGNISANFFIGNGSQLTGVTATNVDANALTGNTLSANVLFSSLTTVGTLADLTVAGTANVGNLTTLGLISVAGNVTGGNVLFGSGIVSGTGNIYAGNIFANISGNIDAAGNLYEIQFNTTGDILGANANFTYDSANNILTVNNGNVVGGNILTAGRVSATANVYGSWFVGNVDAETVTATANISGGNILTAGQVSATGAGTFGNVLTGGTVSATSTIQGGNILTPGEVSATGSLTGGNIFTGGIVSAVSTITGGNLATAGSVTATGTITGGNLATAGFVSATGEISGGNISTTGNVTAANVNATTGFFGNINLTGDITVNSLTSNTFVSATGNLVGGNLFTSGLISATGNVSGNYIIGNGAFLTGIDTTLISNGNTNVQTYANGNVAVTVAGVANTVVFTVAGTDITGNANITGNVTGGNITTAGEVSAAGNITGANVNTTTVYSASDLNLQPVGNVALGNRYITGVRYPSADQDAASKIYVDNLVSTAISYHEAVFAATISTLATATGGTVTYNQPGGAGNGIGATLTTTGSFNLIDTANVQTAGTRILVKNEANAAHNGVYVWSNATVITRSSDADTAGVGNAFALGLNDYFFVTNGNVNSGSAWIVDAPTGNIVFGTSNIEFAQFSQSQVYSANISAGLSLTGTVFSAKVDNNTTAFDGGGNIIVKAGANLTTPNIGDATGSSLSVTGNVTGGNIDTAGYVTATGNVTGGNIITAGNITATGNITGNYFIGNGSQLTGVTAASVDAGDLTGNTLSSNVLFSSLTTVGTLTSLSVSGNIDGGNVATAGAVTATGSVTGGNLVTSGVVTATGSVTGGNVFTGGVVSATGNVTGGNLVTGGYITATGTVYSGNVLTPGEVSAGGSLTGGNIFTGGQISAVSTITGGNIATTGYVTATGNITGGNIVSAGQISATGNITAPTFLGNLEGTTASLSGNVIGGNITTGGSVTATGNITGGNINTAGAVSVTGNVTAGNVLFDAGIVSGTGNIYAGNIFANISGNIDAAGSNTEIQFNDNGILGATAGFTFNTAGNILTANGNINGANLFTGGQVSATGNITGGNLLFGAGIVSGTGNIYANNIFANISGNIDAAGNINEVQFNGTGDILTASAGFTFDPSANVLTANGNINGANLFTGGVVSAVGSVAGGNIITGGSVTAAGNITGGNIVTTGQVSGGTLDVTGNAVINGDLAVNGNITYINVTSFNVEDPIIGLGRGANDSPLTANDGKDRGEQLWYFNTGANVERSAFIGYDNSANKIIAAIDVTIANEIVTVNNYGTFEAGNVEATTVSATGNITGGNILFGSGVVSGTGNIYANNIFANISGNIDAAGNINEVQFNGSGDILTASAGFTFDPSSNVLTANGNINGANLFTGGHVSATGNITGNTVIVGNILIPSFGNVTVGNVNINDLAEPFANSDAATKFYVDSVAANVLPIISNQTITPDGISNTFVLNQTATDVGILLTINGITQTPATNYTVTGNSLTMAETPLSSDIIQVRYLTGTQVGVSGTNYANANVVAYGQSGWAGNIIPSGNAVYSLGNATNQWKDLYVSGNTIYIGNVPMTIANSVLSVDGNAILSNNSATSISTTGNITAGNLSATGNVFGTVNGYSIGYLDIPQVVLSANSTAALANSGKHYYSTTAGNLALTLPDNNSVAFPTGATLTIVVNAAGNVLVNQGTGVSLYQAGSSTTGNRVVGAYGLATVMKVAANTWVISGTGVY